MGRDPPDQVAPEICRLLGEGRPRMKFSEVMTQSLAWLQREGRISYRALKREFERDDEFLEDLKVELIDAQRVVVDEDGKVLIWVGALPVPSSRFKVPSCQPPTPDPRSPSRGRSVFSESH